MDGQPILQLTAGDVNELGRSILGRYGAALEIELRDKEAFVRASVPAPSNPFGRFVNISAVVGETAAIPRLDTISLGDVPVPR